eukprot:806948-Amphidinium_carterae.1
MIIVGTVARSGPLCACCARDLKLYCPFLMCFIDKKNLVKSDGVGWTDLTLSSYEIIDSVLQEDM